MNIQIIRHRATRKSFIGILHVGEFECFTLERRTDMLDEGSHTVTNSDYGNLIRFGDHVLTDKSRRDGAGGVLGVGLSVGRYNLHETGNAYEALKKIVNKAVNSGAEVTVEVIDNIKDQEE